MARIPGGAECGRRPTLLVGRVRRALVLRSVAGTRRLMPPGPRSPVPCVFARLLLAEASISSLSPFPLFGFPRSPSISVSMATDFDNRRTMISRSSRTVAFTAYQRSNSIRDTSDPGSPFHRAIRSPVPSGHPVSLLPALRSFRSIGIELVMSAGMRPGPTRDMCQRGR